MKPDHDVESITCDDANQFSPNFTSKWVVPILHILIIQPKRFSELRRELGTVTQKSLTAALRDLERDGLVKRTVTPIIPPRVDYELTPLGRSFHDQLHQFGVWAYRNREAVKDARDRFKDVR